MRQFHEDIFKYSLLKTDTYIFVDNSVDNFLFVKKWLIFQLLFFLLHEYFFNLLNKFLKNL